LNEWLLILELEGHRFQVLAAPDQPGYGAAGIDELANAEAT
jgi:hypothetical protein